MPEDERPAIQLVEERVEVGKRQVERGRVVVHTRVEEREELAEVALHEEDVIASACRSAARSRRRRWCARRTGC